MIVLQLVLYCLLFTLMVRYAVRGGAVDGLYFYPKPVQERAIELGITAWETIKKKRKILKKPVYLKDGDVIKCVIDGIGELINTVGKAGQNEIR